MHLYKLGIHGLQQQSLYLHQGQFGCGPNFAISLPHQHLTLHLANPPAGCNPHTLYLQFNNCSRENKNKYMPDLFCKYNEE
jgi:hypothetical protein